MKTIGLLGGMSWESSSEYYKLINEYTKEIVGDTHSCKSIIYTFDFDAVEKLQHENKWDELTDEMITQSKNLKNAGADFIVICTNTMHKMAKNIEDDAKIKVLHICDAVANEVKKLGLNRVALLGTKFTMLEDFYKSVFIDNYGISIDIPDGEDIDIVHNIIYKELILGTIKESSKKEYVRIIEKLAEKGSQGVVLGCTEIPLLIKSSDVSIPVFDTTDIHARAAVEYANK